MATPRLLASLDSSVLVRCHTRDNRDAGLPHRVALALLSVRVWFLWTCNLRVAPRAHVGPRDRQRTSQLGIQVHTSSLKDIQESKQHTHTRLPRTRMQKHESCRIPTAGDKGKHTHFSPRSCRVFETNSSESSFWPRARAHGWTSCLLCLTPPCPSYARIPLRPGWIVLPECAGSQLRSERLLHPAGGRLCVCLRRSHRRGERLTRISTFRRHGPELSPVRRQLLFRCDLRRLGVAPRRSANGNGACRWLRERLLGRVLLANTHRFLTDRSISALSQASALSGSALSVAS